MHIGFWWESQKEGDHEEDLDTGGRIIFLDTGGRIILRWILER
jgi:hypothetical protein